jgi:hypothetical protein
MFVTDGVTQMRRYNMYILIEDSMFNTKTIKTENSFIPLDPDNLDYQKVLDDIIDQGADCFDGDIPTDLQAAADAKQFAQQLESYTTATARLAQYVLSVGRAEVTESQATGEQVLNEETGVINEITADVVTVTAIDPVDATITRLVYPEEGGDPTEEEIENPLITKDNAERAAAQVIVDATPQPVIDEYNS